MSMIGGLVESDAVSTRGSSYTARLVIGVELEVANEIARMVVEAGEVLRGRLL